MGPVCIAKIIGTVATLVCSTPLQPGTVDARVALAHVQNAPLPAPKEEPALVIDRPTNRAFTFPPRDTRPRRLDGTLKCCETPIQLVTPLPYIAVKIISSGLPLAAHVESAPAAQRNKR